ncbi:MAG: GTPase HflX, partial [bacterium]|nr:GTPase HflX [bacterium]
NKLDLLDPEAAAVAHETASRRHDVVILSALTGEGIDQLQRIVSVKLTAGARVHALRVPLADGAAMAWLHEHGEVIDSVAEDSDMLVQVRLSESALARFAKRERINP